MRKPFLLIIFFCVIILTSTLTAYCEENNLAGAANKYYIQNLHDKTENYFDKYYKGKSTVTIFVNQPIPGTRYAASNTDFFFTGHAFVRLQYYEPDNDGKLVKKVIYRGFYPIEILTMQQVIDRPNLKAVIGTEQSDPAEWDHIWQVGKVYTITQNGAKRALEYINHIQQDNVAFNSQRFNCTTFVVSVLKEAGVKETFVARDMKFTPEQQIYIWQNNYPLENTTTYTTGEVGEDLRKSGSYITLTDTGIINNTNLIVPSKKTIDYKYFIKEKNILQTTAKQKLTKYMKENSLKLKPGKYKFNNNMKYEELLKIFKFTKIKTS